MRILIFLAMLLWGGAAAAQTAQVTDTANVNMRSGKAENYRIIRVLPPRTELEVIEVDQDYAKVKAADGETGWVLRKFLDIRKVETQNASQNQAALEAAQKELVMVRVEMANLQRDLEKRQQQGQEGTASPLRFLLLVVLGAFAAGMVTGVMILKAYYQKRLHGLRI
jgi:uncharacterized protein YgiM (DUF1202 family)